jgi:hypothetical protein
MRRAPQSRQPTKETDGSDRPPRRDRARDPRDPDGVPADRETRRDEERVRGAHKRRDGDGDDRDRDDRDDAAYEHLTGPRRGRSPTHDGREDDVYALDEDDPDIMEVLDLDDLNQMEGPDA